MSGSLGGAPSSGGSSGGGTSYTCATNPSFANLGVLTTGTPTSASQAWTYNASNTGPCTYACTGGYSGSGCSTAPIYSAGQPYYPSLTYSAGQTFTYGGAIVNVSAVGRGTSNSTYLNCPTADIVIWSNGATVPQIWSLCNVGASSVFTGYQATANDSPAATSVTAGKMFQW